ncbi:MAG: RNA polymerase factor sigma-54 [Muribaculaceae bacterium]|nr:RNA polymerase factor sigma-54 [Muribaculaceae bacterium]
MQSQNLELTQKTVQRLSHQQLRLVRMLEMNTPELEEAVERELEDNPALGVEEETTEEDTRRYPLYTPARNRDGDDRPFTPPDESESLYDRLLAELSEKNLSPEVDATARFIIGSLDSNGYLTRSLRDIVDDLAFGPGLEVTVAQAEEALEAVKSLDPPGIGAADLQECLRIQLERMAPGATRTNALRIINDAYEAFTMKHRHRIVSALRLSDKEVDEALDLILSLNPKPGATLGNDPARAANVIIPDFTVSDEEGHLTIALTNAIPELRIERSFEQAMKELDRTASGRPKKGSEFIVSRYNDARDFIRILRQRQETMMTVMAAIVRIQEEYLRTEDVYRLKPMMLKDVADMTGLDLSAISRVTSNKYVALPWGIFPLRFFFSDSIGEGGEGAEATTNRKIEARISYLIEKEDKLHPLSDQKIMEVMQEEGFDLSRRTVAKYRDRLGLPVARLRKKLKS